ncbi:hypothetical protein [Burkholderia cenocepacia]|uniref:hypothetical protein n=1 Tax=Burkholderia cenocepacia TaxID=95486 RepID=UPI00075B3D21|nr:hypothetical protein [Burkholderia cenocepacia]AOK37132.1 hypothetical protein WL90_22605 [Burkholderia cenocepacia]KWF60375.1 hypothetical protein WL89_15640 [Burkholderia cenocepacia]
MSTMELGESGEISMRTYMSMNYLTSAALLARKAHEIEAKYPRASPPSLEESPSLDDLFHPDRWPSQATRAEHHAYASGAIMMSAAAVEAFVNELFAECRDRPGRNHLRIARSHAALLARVWTEVPAVERDAVLAKFDLALRLLDLPGLGILAASLIRATWRDMRAYEEQLALFNGEVADLLDGRGPGTEVVSKLQADAISAVYSLDFRSCVESWAELSGLDSHLTGLAQRPYEMHFARRRIELKPNVEVRKFC